jgi:general secretion pathway protein A
MYANYWGLADTPFRNGIETRCYYQSPGHEEALARLLFLVENRRRCGVLAGAAGTGKSLVLEIARGEALRAGSDVASIDLFGRSSREMVWEILAGLRRSPGVDETPHRLWRKLHDHVLANQGGQGSLVLILDHLDRAHADCLGVVERLQHVAAGAETGLTLILGVRQQRDTALWQGLREISDLRIELEALDREQTRRYIEARILRAGGEAVIFDQSAIDRLFEETRGIPRELNRLCDLALLAGMADHATQIDEPIVAAAAEELHVRFPAEHRHASIQHRFAAGV